MLCLAFPLHPPGRGDDPAKSRQPELDTVTVPTLVVQGRSDPFGMPAGGSWRELAVVAGNHGLKADLESRGRDRRLAAGRDRLAARPYFASATIVFTRATPAGELTSTM